MHGPGGRSPGVLPEQQVKRHLVVIVASAFLTIVSIAGAAATTPPGQRGYEGQPGHQGNGLGGYEGRPGNQGGG